MPLVPSTILSRLSQHTPLYKITYTKPRVHTQPFNFTTTLYTVITIPCKSQMTDCSCMRSFPFNSKIQSSKQEQFCTFHITQATALWYVNLVRKIEMN